MASDFRCENPGCQEVFQFVASGGLIDCPKCGGRLRGIHPLEAKPVQFANWAIQAEFERGFAMIEARLAAEAELDRIDSLWYNTKKRSPNGEETDDGDRV